MGVIPASVVRELVAGEAAERPTRTVSGTAALHDGVMYVRIDGSDQLTPIASSTAGMHDGDRVSVQVSGHSARVVGNVSDPSATGGDLDSARQELGSKITELENVVADTVTTDELQAERARIDSLVAEDALIKGRLDATEASVGDLEADSAEISGKLTAAEADIDRLEASKADVGALEAEYAKIDFANIGEAAVEELFAKSGIIEDMVVSEGHVTGRLVGVTIIGDLIEGGTVKADRLVVQGEDGLYYKLNVSAETVAAQQTEYNSLNGDVITAHTITAEKVNVDDLVAFDATIGGFHIGTSDLHSGSKASADSAVPGVFLGDDGQFSVGDGDEFVRFWHDDADGSWHLSISADELSLSSGGSVSDMVGQAQAAAEAAQDAADAAQAKADEAGSAAASAASDLADAQEALADVQSQADATDEELAAAKQAVAQAQAAAEAAQSKADSAQADADAAQSAADAAQGDLDAYKAEAAGTYATKSELTQTADGISATVSQVSGVADGAMAKATEVEQTVDGISTTVTGLDGRVSQVEQDSAGFQVTLGQVQEAAEGAQSAASSAQSAASAAQSAASSAQSTASALSGRATQTYSFGGSSSAVWVMLGTLKTSIADTVDITVFAGIGYNGLYSQNSKLYITVRDGNHQATDASNRYGVTVTREGNESTEVQVRSSQYGTAQVWVHFTGAYANGSYSISKASDVTWTHSGTMQSGAPTGGTAQSLGYLTNAAAAAKTATNYLKFDSSGLCVGNHTSTLTYNTLVKSTGVDIRNGSTVLSSFGASSVSLGQNSSSSQINMCAGGLRITRSGNNATVSNTVATTSGSNNCLLTLQSGNASVDIKSRGIGGVPTVSIDGVLDLSGASKVATTANGTGFTPAELYNAVYNAAYVRTLWSGGGWFMNASQTASLSQSVSSQPRGIVLHWCGYVSGATQNYEHFFHLVPKSAVPSSGTIGVSSGLMHSANASVVGCKYVYVGNTSVKGNDYNSRGATSAAGLTVTPNRWVLYRIYGV